MGRRPKLSEPPTSSELATQTLRPRRVDQLTHAEHQEKNRSRSRTGICWQGPYSGGSPQAT